jgi:hypothetical protein
MQVNLSTEEIINKLNTILMGLEYELVVKDYWTVNGKGYTMKNEKEYHVKITCGEPYSTHTVIANDTCNLVAKVTRALRGLTILANAKTLISILDSKCTSTPNSTALRDLTASRAGSNNEFTLNKGKYSVQVLSRVIREMYAHTYNQDERFVVTLGQLTQLCL